MPLRGRREKENQGDKTVEIDAQMQGSLTFSDPVNLKINGQFQGSLDTKGTLTIPRFIPRFQSSRVCCCGSVELGPTPPTMR